MAQAFTDYVKDVLKNEIKAYEKFANDVLKLIASSPHTSSTLEDIEGDARYVLDAAKNLRKLAKVTSDDQSNPANREFKELLQDVISKGVDIVSRVVSSYNYFIAWEVKEIAQMRGANRQDYYAGSRDIFNLEFDVWQLYCDFMAAQARESKSYPQERIPADMPETFEQFKAEKRVKI